MKIIDLTQLMTASMPVYPGTDPRHLTVANTYETDGFREHCSLLFPYRHPHGAPFHLFGDRTKLNEMPAAQFVGKALVIPCMQYGAGEEIGMEALAPVRRLADEADFLLFHTGWSRCWGEANIRGLSVPPWRSPLCAGKRQKGLGFDTHRH